MNKTAEVQKSAIQVFEETLVAEQARLNREFIDSIQARMAELNMSQADMAYTLGKSRAYISKLFAQDQNLTIKTMVELVTTLEMNLAIKVRPKRALSSGTWVNDPDKWFGTVSLRLCGDQTSSVARNTSWSPLATKDSFDLDHDMAVAV